MVGSPFHVAATSQPERFGGEGCTATLGHPSVGRRTAAGRACPFASHRLVRLQGGPGVETEPAHPRRPALGWLCRPGGGQRGCHGASGHGRAGVPSRATGATKSVAPDTPAPVPQPGPRGVPLGSRRGGPRGGHRRRGGRRGSPLVVEFREVGGEGRILGRPAVDLRAEPRTQTSEVRAEIANLELHSVAMLARVRTPGLPPPAGATSSVHFLDELGSRGGTPPWV